MSITRQRGNIANANVAELKPDVSSEVALLDANRYPLYALLTSATAKDPVTGNTSKIKEQACHSHKFSWFENKFVDQTDAINNGSGYAASATSLVVDNGSYFTVNDILKVPRTGENMQVTAISTNTLTVTRGLGTTTAAALVDNDPIWIVGNAFGQGGAKANANNTVKSEEYGYCQIFKTSIDIAGSTMASDTYLGDYHSSEIQKKAIEHQIQIERAFLFSSLGSGTDAGGKTEYFTDGLLNKITTNIQDESSSTLTEDEFESFLETYVFAHGSSTKYLLASPTVISSINKFARTDIRTVPKEEAFGLALKEYVSPHGTLYIVKEPLFTGSIYGGYAVALDLVNIRKRYLRNTMLEKDVNKDGTDSQIDQFLTETGIEIRQEKTHSVLKGVYTS